MSPQPPRQRRPRAAVGTSTPSPAAAGRHVFVDESKRDAYVIAAVHVTADDVTDVRRALAALRAAGTRRVHFQAENDGARRRFLAELARLHDAGRLTAAIYIDTAPRDLDARAATLRQLVRHVLDAGGGRLVLEQDDSVVVHDQKLIRAARAEHPNGADALRFDHLRAAAEPLLWAPDALAWAWCRDRTWRALARPIVDEIHGP